MLEERLCAYCNEPFVPTNGKQIYCKRPHYTECPVCHKKTLVTYNDKLKMKPMTCSYECRSIMMREDSLKKYGTTSPGASPQARAKARATMQQKYGVAYAFQSKELREKGKQTCIEKYGVDNPAKSAEIRAKTEATCMKRYGYKTNLLNPDYIANYHAKLKERYGVLHPAQSKEIQKKIKATTFKHYGTTCYLTSQECKDRLKKISLERYGTEVYQQAPEVINKRKQTSARRWGADNPAKTKIIKQKIHDVMIDKYGTVGALNILEIRAKIVKTSMERYGLPYYIMTPGVAQSSGKISKINLKCQSKFTDIGIACELEHTIGSKAYDLYLPNLNIAIDINPTYTHSLIGNHWTLEGRPNNYHLDRCLNAINNNVNIRMIYDWDSIDAVVKELSNPHIVADDKTCDVFKLTRAAYTTFLSNYGLARSRKFPRRCLALGTAKDGVLYAVGLFVYDKELDGICLINYGIRYGYAPEQHIAKIVAAAKQLTDDKVYMRMDADRIMLSYLDGLDMKLVGTKPGELYWSKGSAIQKLTQKSDYNAMIFDGWMPIETSGYVIAELK